MNKGLLIYAWSSIVMLLGNMLLTALNILPDWWYKGWLSSVETSKVLTMATSGIFIVILVSMLIWSKIGR